MPRPYWIALAAALIACGVIDGAAQNEVAPADFVVTLERTACFGECPIYSVTIDAQGNVNYDGTRFVRVQGLQTDRISPSSVNALFSTAMRVGCFDMRDSYRALITDLPTTYVTITANGRTKRIEDYVDAPAGLRQLERAIDDAAQTRRWIRIDVPTLQQMRRDGWVGAPEERAELLRRALQSDDVDVVKELIDIGVDPNTPYYTTNTTPLMVARSAAAARALIAAGALVSARNDNGVTPLGIAACAGNVALVHALLDAGADPSSPGWAGSPALECARRNKDAARRAGPAAGLGTTPPFVPDYDGVIAALEQALKK